MDLTNYEKYRPLMKTGDTLLYKRRNFFSWLIRLFSPGFNHASIVIRFNEYNGQKDRVWTLEAELPGVILTFLSRSLARFKGSVWWYPLKDEFNCKRESIGLFILEQSGKPYDFRSLFKNIFGRVNAEIRAIFCSELNFLAYKEAGILSGNIAPRPGDIPSWNIFKTPVKL